MQTKTIKLFLILVFTLAITFQAYAASFKATKKKAEKGNAKAQFELGKMFSEGKGAPKDEINAMYWFKKSAEQGFPEAMGYLAWEYNGSDYKKAFYWFQKFSQTDKCDACDIFNLGSIYYLHYKKAGISQDYIKALYWFKKSAEMDQYIHAQFCLGVMHYKGEGISKDYTKAFYWLKKSAEQGCDGAQSWLATMYCDGKGTARDYRKAAYWIKKSSDEGNEEAKKLWNDGLKMFWVNETAKVRKRSKKVQDAIDTACLAKAKKNKKVWINIGSISMKELCKDAPTVDGPINCFCNAMDDGYITLALVTGRIAKLCSGANNSSPIECFKDTFPDSSITDSLGYDASDFVVAVCKGAQDMIPAKRLRWAIDREKKMYNCNKNLSKAKLVEIYKACVADNFK